MKKILVVFDGYNFSPAALDFVQSLSQEGAFLLTGVFLSSIDYKVLLGYPFASPSYITAVEYDNELYVNNVAYFKNFCEQNGIEYRIHDDLGGEALNTLKMETRFADALILGSETFFKDVELNTPGEYLKEILHDAECPVLLLPENCPFPERIVLSYDGSRQSMYALKQFAYVFPELCKKETLLVYGSTEDDELPNIDLLEEFAGRHYSNLTLLKLDLDPKVYFDTWLVNNKKALVVSGAYGRSGASMFFKHSFMNDMIKEHQLPLVIAHT